ncbi:MAG: hypothetical protein R2838_20460 [Caldilineaceae bacterium]
MLGRSLPPHAVGIAHRPRRANANATPSAARGDFPGGARRRLMRCGSVAVRRLLSNFQPTRNASVAAPTSTGMAALPTVAGRLFGAWATRLWWS